jgi:hypothetical protein
MKWRQDDLAKRTQEPQGVQWNFSGHYNGALKRCLVEVKSAIPLTESKSEKPLAIASWIYDAFELQFIAKSLSIRDPKDPKEQFVTTCDIFNEPKSESECRSLMQQ